MVFGGIGRKPYEFIGFCAHRLTLKNNAQRTSGLLNLPSGLNSWLLESRVFKDVSGICF